MTEQKTSTEIPRLSESFDDFDFIELNGQSGLWLLKSKVNNSGMALFENITTGNRKLKLAKKCKYVNTTGVLCFNTDNNMHFKETMDRIWELEQKGFLDTNKIGHTLESPHDIMEIINEDYNTNVFRPYHLDKLLKFYRILKAIVESKTEQS